MATNRQTFHDFVRRVWPEGRNSTGSVFYEHERIFSYGYHFLLGMIAEEEEGTVLYVNQERYSVTTSKHRSQLIRAALDAGIPQSRIRGFGEGPPLPHQTNQQQQRQNSRRDEPIVKRYVL